MSGKAMLWTAGVAAVVFVAFALASNFGFDIRSVLPAPKPKASPANPEGAA